MNHKRKLPRQVRLIRAALGTCLALSASLSAAAAAPTGVGVSTHGAPTGVGVSTHGAPTGVGVISTHGAPTGVARYAAHSGGHATAADGSEVGTGSSADTSPRPAAHGTSPWSYEPGATGVEDKGSSALGSGNTETGINPTSAEPESGGEHSESQLDPTEESLPETEYTGSLKVYSDPDHADVVTAVDPETGQEQNVVSGITHWVEAPAMGRLARSFARASSTPISDILKVSITPKQGTIGSGTLPRMRIDLAIPTTAQDGDVYTANLSIPWTLSSALSSGVEIKDANGIVFAIAQSVWVRDTAAPDRYSVLKITLAGAAQTHADIVGFIEFDLSYLLKSTQQDVPIIVTSDGMQLAKSGTWTVPAEGSQVPSISANGGAYAAGQPRIVPYMRIPADRIPSGGWTVTLSDMQAGLTPVCEGILEYRGPDANGFITTRSLRIEPVTCTKAKSSFLMTRADLTQVGVPTNGYVTFRAALAGALPSTHYSATLSSSISLYPGDATKSWTVGNTTGKPPTAGASSLELHTKKTASFTGNGVNRPVFGDTVTYTITTTPGKTNPRAITGVMTVDVLPLGLQFVSASGSATYDSASRKVTWGPRTLTSTGKFTDTITTKITSVPASQSLVNTVENTADGVCKENDALSTCTATATTPVGIPSFSFTKSAQLENTNKNGWTGDKGDTIKYTFTVTNTGASKITKASLTDDLLNLKSVQCLATGVVLNPGDSKVCQGTYSHVITDKNVTAGKVVNQATLCVDPALGLACKPATTTTPTLAPSFKFTKRIVSITNPTGKSVKDGEAAAGDTIRYGFAVQNTGNADIQQMFVTDPMLKATKVECLTSTQVLKPAATATCANNPLYDYVITEPDAKAGLVHNVATGSVTGLPNQTAETETLLKPPHVPVDLPRTGQGGTWAFAGGGFVLVLTGALALNRIRKNSSI